MIAKLGARLPRGLKHWVRTQLNELSGIADKRAFVRELHDIWDGRYTGGGFGYSLDPAFEQTPPIGSLLPVPPKRLWAGYAESPEPYLNTGKGVSEQIRKVWADYNVDPRQSRVLDWGCAAGRVLRNFSEDAAEGEFWGTDVSEAAILWDTMNLSPPINFVTCTQYPHLPFEDRYFDFVYAISVFTHLEYLTDTWLMELRRVMKPGALALFSINNHESIRHFEEVGYPVFMQPHEGREALRHEAFVIRSGDWLGTLPIYSTDFIRNWWSRYFEVVEVRERYIDSYQAAVILRKRG